MSQWDTRRTSTDRYPEGQRIRGAYGCSEDGKVISKIPQHVITVRLPAPMHNALKELAHDRKTSLNLLCVEMMYRFLTLDKTAADIKATAEATEDQMSLAVADELERIYRSVGAATE